MSFKAINGVPCETSDQASALAADLEDILGYLKDGFYGEYEICTLLCVATDALVAASYNRGRFSKRDNEIPLEVE
jgi:hypothetical protein